MLSSTQKDLTFSKWEFLKGPPFPNQDLRNQSLIVFLNVSIFLFFSLAYSKSSKNIIASLSHLEEYFWSLELAVLEIRNSFDDAQLSSFLNHTSLKHSRRLTNVPGETDQFLILSLEVLSDRSRRDLSLFCSTTRTLLQDGIDCGRLLHFPTTTSFLFSYPLSQTYEQHSVTSLVLLWRFFQDKISIWQNLSFPTNSCYQWQRKNRALFILQPTIL